MSLIRQRSKNLLIAGVCGFFIALLCVIGISIFVLRGNVQAVTWLLADKTVDIVERKPEENIEKKIGVYLLTQSVQKNQVISQTMLKRVDLLESLVPKNAVLDIEQIINKKGVMNLEENTLITQQLILDLDLQEVMSELIEIRDIPFPQIFAQGDRINLRIHYPSGQDYIVLENKEVVFVDTEQKSFFISLTDEEILSFSSAREDIVLYPGTLFYVSKEITIIDKLDATNLANKDAWLYTKYPLNPNSLQLSCYSSDTLIMNQRKSLDDSLLQYFTEEANKFSYVIDENLSVEQLQTTDDGTTHNVSEKTEQSGAKEAVTGQTQTGQTQNNQTDTGETQTEQTQNIQADTGETQTEQTQSEGTETEQPVNTSFGF